MFTVDPYHMIYSARIVTDHTELTCQYRVKDGSSVSSGERDDHPIIQDTEIVRISSIISDETFQRLSWLSEETEELAIQDSLCTDTRLQFTATNVTCKGLTIARKCPIIHGDRKSMSYYILEKLCEPGDLSLLLTPTLIQPLCILFDEQCSSRAPECWLELFF